MSTSPSKNLLPGDRVIIIGAGASGLTAIKCCLEEGLDVICFEMTDNIGGLWRYREEESSDDGLASVMRSTIINTSKEMTAFSDFPPPEDFPNFMHNTYFVRYLEMYAKHFKLVPHIHLRHKVVAVQPIVAGDGDGGSAWSVTVHNLVTDTTEVRRASAVMVCTGHHGYPYRPHFQGQDSFRGRILHSHTYRHFKEFESKRVVVVGIGNSGGDLAVELSHIASKVYLSSRRGSWVMPRMGDYGQPIDIQYGRRYIVRMLNITPAPIKNCHAAIKLNARWDHSVYNLKPEHGFYSQHPMVNDELPGRLLSGAITLKSDVSRFTEDGVIFDGDSTVYPVDAVLLATGYDIRFPFLSDDILEVKGDNRVSLYKHVFPPNSTNLVFVGLVQPFGALPPICELQARWAVQVFIGRYGLPKPEVMRKRIAETQERHDRRYVRSKRHTIEVDGIPYMDEIAVEFDARPHLLDLALRDFPLFWECMFGPCLPYHFRLNGPNPWSGARSAILGGAAGAASWQHRVHTPLNTRALRDLTQAGAIEGRAMAFIRNVIASFLLMTLFLFMSFPV